MKLVHEACNEVSVCHTVHREVVVLFTIMGAFHTGLDQSPIAEPVGVRRTPMAHIVPIYDLIEYLWTDVTH